MTSIGHTSSRARVMNATIPPRVSSREPTASAPRSRMRPMTAFGARSRADQNVPRSCALATWVWYTTSACARCRAQASSRRPSAFSTRIPVAASST